MMRKVVRINGLGGRIYGGSQNILLTFCNTDENNQISEQDLHKTLIEECKLNGLDYIAQYWNRSTQNIHIENLSFALENKIINKNSKGLIKLPNPAQFTAIIPLHYLHKDHDGSWCLYHPLLQAIQSPDDIYVPSLQAIQNPKYIDVYQPLSQAAQTPRYVQAYFNSDKTSRIDIQFNKNEATIHTKKPCFIDNKYIEKNASERFDIFLRIHFLTQQDHYKQDFVKILYHASTGVYCIEQSALLEKANSNNVKIKDGVIEKTFQVMTEYPGYLFLYHNLKPRTLDSATIMNDIEKERLKSIVRFH